MCAGEATGNHRHLWPASVSNGNCRVEYDPANIFPSQATMVVCCMRVCQSIPGNKLVICCPTTFPFAALRAADAPEMLPEYAPKLHTHNALSMGLK